MQRRDRAGQRIYCESDGKIYPVPSWMLSPECSQLSLGPPLTSAEALAELHELLTSLPIHADCDKASLNSPPKEGVDETIGKITPPANELPLLNVPATTTPDEQQNELTIALTELLISAAEEENGYEKNEQAGNGGKDESETHA
jgi:hypothetical protein